MPQQPNALIERISDDHHIEFNSASDAEKIYIYKHVLRESSAILQNKPEQIPIKALRDIQDALNQIMNGFYELRSKSISANMYENVNKAIPMMIDALAHLNAALIIYNEGGTTFRAQQMAEFFKCLLNCRRQIIEVNRQLEGGIEEQKPLPKEAEMPSAENEISSHSAGTQPSQPPLSPVATQDPLIELNANNTSSTKVNTIYLSSTYSDLQECREAVYHALRTMHYHVIAMEDYVSADQRPLEKCFADIASCDLYIGIFAWRYGYAPTGGNPDHRSITELEYRKARELGKPCLLFCLDETAPWPPSDMDVTTGEGDQGERIRKLRQDLASEHVISFFSSPEHLAKKVSLAVERLNIQINSERANREAKLRSLLADQSSFLQDRLSSFVGRQAELAQLRQRSKEILQTGGYITITGPNGQGKSSIIAKLVV